MGLSTLIGKSRRQNPNPNLEKLLNLCEEVEYETIWSFFTPKLTSEEMKLVQERNEEHLKTYHDH